MADQTLQGVQDDFVRERIIALLTVYPILSPSMIQIGLGSSLPTFVWRPVFDRMLISGELVEGLVEGPPSDNRQRPFKTVSLAKQDSVA